MPTSKAPRHGSLQFWPRKRITKFLPSSNWRAISDSNSKKIKGFIGYKVGMFSAYVKDLTANSLTKDKKVIIPVTIIECPSMKIFSVRFSKHGKVVKEILNDGLEKELKSKLKLPKSKEQPNLNSIKPEEYDDITVIVYSQVKKTSIKKTPDVIELGLKGSIEEKLNFAKEHLNKEINISDVFESNQLIDIRGLTKGKGLQGPLKRFGLKLKFHKSEKGRRRPGSLGPWHPARVTFRAPMAGQMGMFTRIAYNNKIVGLKKPSESPVENVKHYGNVKNEYLIMRGSVHGPAKRQLLLTAPLRITKKQDKKKFEFIELR